jgi:hypothetical protein
MANELERRAGQAPAGKGDVDFQTAIGLDHTLAVIEQRTEFVERLHAMILKRVEPAKDIKRIGANWRRTINFARKAYRVIGGDIKWYRDPQTGSPFKREQRTDAEGPYFVYSCSCTWVTPWGENVEAWSLISSRESFFGEDNEQFRPVSDVDEHDIAEMCKTEAFKGAIFTGLGMPKDISEDELKKCGVDGGRSGGHQFDAAKGRQGGSKDTSQETWDLRAAIEKGCKELFDAQWQPDDADAFNRPEEILQYLTANPEKNWEGWKNFRSIKETQLQRIAAAVKAKVAEVIPDDNLPLGEGPEGRGK